MKKFIIAFSFLILFSCNSSDIKIEEISFLYENNNAQPSLVSNNGKLSNLRFCSSSIKPTVTSRAQP